MHVMLHLINLLRKLDNNHAEHAAENEGLPKLDPQLAFGFVRGRITGLTASLLFWGNQMIYS
tara:strand:- start:330 stop:515 length:186 start_codon:yes stop_codon:yes gene_type:complete